MLIMPAMIFGCSFALACDLSLSSLCATSIAPPGPTILVISPMRLSRASMVGSRTSRTSCLARRFSSASLPR